MNKTDVMQRYIEDFTLLLKRCVKPGVNSRSFLFPITTKGGVFEIHLENTAKSSVEIKNEFPDIVSCLKTLKQNFVAEASLNSNIHFGGTNFFLDGNRILIIKGEDDKWSNDDIVSDFNRFFSALTGRNK